MISLYNTNQTGACVCQRPHFLSSWIFQSANTRLGQNDSGSDSDEFYRGRVLSKGLFLVSLYVSNSGPPKMLVSSLNQRETCSGPLCLIPFKGDFRAPSKSRPALWALMQGPYAGGFMANDVAKRPMCFFPSIFSSSVFVVSDIFAPCFLLQASWLQIGTKPMTALY